MDPRIDDLQSGPLARTIGEGYAVNIDASLMTDDLEPYRKTPRRPARRMASDIPSFDFPRTPEGKIDMQRLSEVRPVYETVFLVFPDRAAAVASSLGPYLPDPA